MLNLLSDKSTFTQVTQSLNYTLTKEVRHLLANWVTRELLPEKSARQLQVFTTLIRTWKGMHSLPNGTPF